MFSRALTLLKSRTGQLLLSSLAAQGLFVLVTPILTRLYRVEVLAIFGLYSSIMGVLVPVAGLRYEQAVTLAETDDEAVALCALSLLISIPGAVLLALALVLVTRSPWLIQTLHVDPELLVGLKALVVWAPLGMVILNLNQALVFWALRKKRFKLVANVRVQQGVVGPAVQLAAGVSHAGGGGLVLGHVIGQAAGIAGILWHEGKVIARHSAALSLRHLRDVSAEWRKFPQLSTWAALLNGLGGNLPTLFIAGAYGSTVTGLYTLAMGVVFAPLDLIGRAVSQVYFADISESRRGDSSGAVVRYLRVLKVLSLVALAVCVPVVALAPWGVPIVFGDKWADASIYIQLLVVVGGVRLVSNTLASTLEVFDRQELYLWREAQRFLGVLLLLAFGPMLGMSAVMLVAALSAVQIATYLLGLVLSWRVVKRFDAGPPVAGATGDGDDASQAL